jgi:hypothetical protein
MPDSKFLVSKCMAYKCRSNLGKKGREMRIISGTPQNGPRKESRHTVIDQNAYARARLKKTSIDQQWISRSSYILMLQVSSHLPKNINSLINIGPIKSYFTKWA